MLLLAPEKRVAILAGLCEGKGSKVTALDSPDVGEQWVWTVIDRLSKFVVSYHVGRGIRKAPTRW